MTNKKGDSIKSIAARIHAAAAVVSNDPDFWDAESFSELKKELKEYLKIINNNCCAYCRRVISGEHNMVLDIEHILEKDNFPRLTFNIANLTISCRRCNFKKNAIANMVTTLNPEGEYQSSYTYKFVHPNLDRYTDYIKLARVSINNDHFVKYLPIPKANVPSPEKAWFTYDEFDLRELERFDLMKKMRVRKPSTILALESSKIRDYLAEQFEKSHALRKAQKAQERATKKAAR
ncbi:hypothetical protein EGY31_00315 [Burkholderia multivorans]|uniref:HNH endonuclease n=1 Tax=Burkholderia ubonensis TaxID=101571 RepID=UPI000F6ECCCD|nr:HNH endonuclease signature motif containing protein [Burkholderia ubonensis]AYZ61841.1 hypothetical protein EGY31_00315 [Burkholderia multivorans]VWB55818.1 hypothetical protein BUB20358_02561 [Burkholderia ubonensis]